MTFHDMNFREGDLSSLAGRGDLAVLCREGLADLTTPVAAFARSFAAEPHAFLLESVEGGRAVARYSFLGGGPERIYRIRQGRLSVQAGDDEQVLDGPPLDALRQARGQRRPVRLPGLPPFTGGLVGFFAYDFARSLERLPARSDDDLAVPDAVLGEYRTVVGFDHLRNRILLMAAVDLRGEESDRQASYRTACRSLEELARRQDDPLPAMAQPEGQVEAPQATPSPEHFKQQVRQAKQRIADGEIFQVVLSRRFSFAWDGHPLGVYRLLRSLNPSPYHFFLACNGDHLAGASPEMLARVTDGVLTVRPIAGTRRRGKDPAEDRALEAELQADVKERAEHVMLVDLARNDAGRVSVPGTVRVEDFSVVERFSHVMHLVSTITGRLQPERDALDAFAACFPAGTLTGAPKVRAMEIIEEAEPFRRGPYGGAVAYLDHGGDMDSCITIRTVLMSNGQAHIQAGAGIVADSREEHEKSEIDHKAEAMMAALRMASRSFA